MTQKEQNALEFTKSLIAARSAHLNYVSVESKKNYFRPFVEDGFILADLFEETREKRKQTLTEKTK